MKRKGMMMLAIAAVLTFGAAGSAQAAGWAQSGSAWVYYDNGGSRVYNVWKQGADNQWRYLDSNGEMAVNKWVDDDNYYVDSNGIMLSGQWLKVASTDENNIDGYNWYYFNNNGKAVKETWKKIDNKWYRFDDDGTLMTGWLDDNVYYSGTDGVMKTGWQRLDPPDDETYDEDEENDWDLIDSEEEDDGKYWYYFQASGKKYRPDSDEYCEHKIDGSYYCFNHDGAMQKGWVRIGSKSSSSTAEIAEFRYYGTDGKAKTGWYSIQPPKSLAGNYEDDVEWFYFKSDGTPKTGPQEGTAKTTDLFRIKNVTYLFNDNGNPVYGLQRIYTGDEDYTAYYFGDKKTSSVEKGKQTIEEDDGSISEFYFQESGRGYTGVKDNYLWYMGKLQKADEGTKYMIVSIPKSSDSYTNYVVNTSGKVAKSTTVKDADGVKYKTGTNGILLQVDGESPEDFYNNPHEPIFSE